MRLLILASESKRRVEILRMLGYRFFVVPSRLEERYEGSPIIATRRLAFQKAFKVWKEYKFSTVLGADTVVVLGDRILGKPKDEEEGRVMLRYLSNRWHKVITAVAILSPKGKTLFHDIAWVRFRKIDDEEIDEYIKTGEFADKAGAYAVQGLGAKFVERIRGDFYTVMGLPVCKTDRALRTLLD
ncbi:Maf family protein [Thermocrinis sp.]